MKCYLKKKKKANKYSNNTTITPKIFHCHFKKGISNSPEKVLPNINIKYCIWYSKRALEFEKMNYFIKYNNIYIYNKVISNLPFVNSEYIIDIFSKIRCETNNNDQFLKQNIFFF